MARKNSPSKSSAIQLSAVERVILYVRDTERSARWYSELLGIAARHKEPGWVELETKGVSICLHGGREGGRLKDATSVAFKVDDFDATWRSLKLREVPGLGEPFSPCPGLRCLAFEDPDGNQLGIEGR
ncbi:MAG: VOC family protein [Planctomycetaceae bacterium]|nr:VOC family protein [Planctomycetaceae bacterium]